MLTMHTLFNNQEFNSLKIPLLNIRFPTFESTSIVSIITFLIRKYDESLFRVNYRWRDWLHDFWVLCTLEWGHKRSRSNEAANPNRELLVVRNVRAILIDRSHHIAIRNQGHPVHNTPDPEFYVLLMQCKLNINY